MKKNDKVSKMYQNAKYLSNTNKFLFWINIVISIILTVKDVGSYLSILLFIQVFLIIGSLILTFLNDYINFPAAEDESRKVLIGNSFDKDLSDADISNYYDTDSFQPGVKKLIYNTLQNILYTKEIVDKMFKGKIIPSILLLIIFVFAIRLLNDERQLQALVQVIFSTSYLYGTAKLFVYKLRLNNLYDKLYSNKEGDEILLLSYCFEYECLKSSFKQLLSESIYNKTKDKSNENWEKISNKLLDKE